MAVSHSGRSVAFALALLTLARLAGAADDYQLGPDSQRQPDVPRGTISILRKR